MNQEPETMDSRALKEIWSVEQVKRIGMQEFRRILEEESRRLESYYEGLGAQKSQIRGRLEDLIIAMQNPPPEFDAVEREDWIIKHAQITHALNMQAEALATEQEEVSRRIADIQREIGALPSF